MSHRSDSLDDDNGLDDVKNGDRSRHERSRSDGRRKSRSRSGSRSNRKPRRSHHSRSRSRSHSRDNRRSNRRHSRSRSRSRSPSYRSRSPMSGRKRHDGPRDQPPPSRCLGVFGMSTYTDEKVLSHYFSQYGKLDTVQIVYDKKSGRSRGFGFVYFERLEDAIQAKEGATGGEIDGQRIRIDFSITKRPHTPTPGIYMGRPSRRGDGYSGGGRSPSPYSRRRSRSYSYSPPPRR